MKEAIRHISNLIRRYPKLGYVCLCLIPNTRFTINIGEVGPFQIRLRQDRAFWLRHPLSHDRYPMGALELFLREGGEVVYDIGANIGLYTRFAIDKFGASKVVAFEPMSSNRNQLLKNVGLSDFEDRVTVLPFALSNEDGYAKLQVDDVQGQTAALDQVTGGSPAEGRLSMGLSPKTESVETRLLDSVVYEDGLPKPDIIKIDVEGAEKMVLEGAIKTIKCRSPDIILESHGKVEAKKTVSFLLREGYKLSGKMSERFKKKTGNIIGHDDICKIKNKYDAKFIVASKRNINISMI